MIDGWQTAYSLSYLEGATDELARFFQCFWSLDLLRHSGVHAAQHEGRLPRFRIGGLGCRVWDLQCSLEGVGISGEGSGLSCRLATQT